MPKAVRGEGVWPIKVNPRGVQASPKFALTTEAFHPMKIPITMTASSEPSFIEVKTFCTPLPYLRPLVLVQVRKEMTTSATTWAVESESAYVGRI